MNLSTRPTRQRAGEDRAVVAAGALRVQRNVVGGGAGPALAAHLMLGETLIGERPRVLLRLVRRHWSRR